MRAFIHPHTTALIWAYTASGTPWRLGPILVRMTDERRVVCTHIAQLIDEAQGLIGTVHLRSFPAPADGCEVPGAGPALRTMERAVNLLRHAAEELDDERLRLRDGWT